MFVSLDRPLPPAPSITARRLRPSSRTLSRATIIDVALKVLDEEGLEAVTMRRVADELNTGPASLYAHVANKQELQDELLDRVIGEIEPIVPDPDNWREQTKYYLRSVHDVLIAHKDVAAVALGKIPFGPNSLDSMENLLGLLRASGLDDRTVALGVELLPQYVVGGVYEYAVGWSELKSNDAAEAYSDEVRDYFKALPSDRFPNLVELADEVASFNPDYNERFEFGLEVLISGLEARRQTHPPKRK